jgi:GT2 family glycosyltransferase
MTRHPGISIVVPTWNGLHLLKKHLPSVQQAADYYSCKTGAPTELIVVDDFSHDKTIEEVFRLFPEVRLLRRPANGGFSVASNTGLLEAKYPLIALLNNDVTIHENFFLSQIHHFAGSDVFAVTAKVFEEAPPVFATGGKVGRFRRGFWSVYFNYDVCPDQPIGPEASQALLSVYAVGGFAMYDSDKLRKLGCFTELLSPFHWEDIDLSYRAWKRGWEIRYEPAAIAHHEISATINAHYESEAVQDIAVRNRLLFHWINLHSPSFVLQHLAMLSVLALTRVFALDFGFYRALLGALRRLPQALRIRKNEAALATRSDLQVSQLLSNFYSSFPIRVFRSRAEILASQPQAKAAGDSKSPVDL